MSSPVASTAPQLLLIGACRPGSLVSEMTSEFKCYCWVISAESTIFKVPLHTLELGTLFSLCPPLDSHNLNSKGWQNRKAPHHWCLGSCLLPPDFLFLQSHCSASLVQVTHSIGFFQFRYKFIRRIGRLRTNGRLVNQLRGGNVQETEVT